MGPTAEIQAKNAKLHGQLVGYFGADYATNVPHITGAIKSAPVTMMKVSDLGYSSEVSFCIQAPWGGHQEKANGKDAFVVFGPDGKNFYLCNVDSDGLPIGYVT